MLLVLFLFCPPPLKKEGEGGNSRWARHRTQHLLRNESGRSWFGPAQEMSSCQPLEISRRHFFGGFFFFFLFPVGVKYLEMDGNNIVSRNPQRRESSPAPLTTDALCHCCCVIASHNCPGSPVPLDSLTRSINSKAENKPTIVVVVGGQTAATTTTTA